MDITITLPREKRVIPARKGANLLEVLRENGVPIAANCGGKGTCGKCRVRLDGREALACRVALSHSCAVDTSPSREDGFAILEDFAAPAASGPAGHGYALAVDIGTTTVVMGLVSLEEGRAVAVTSFLNPQRVFGADVITRIAASEEGAKASLTACIREGLIAGMEGLCKRRALSPAQLKDIVVAGNTTMLYLLLGYDCESLGRAPFRPAFPHWESYAAAEALGVDLPCPVHIVPWVSAFVGGDIVAGLLSCTALSEGPFLLMDMGTNGELALRFGDRLLCTATAAGPAFEGGNIGWGVGGIPGAIDSVRWGADGPVITTIADAPPVGICGSGVMDAAACLVREGLVDETGRLEDENHFRDGVALAHTRDGRPIAFTQKDMRELQLAKSAVRSGAEILLAEGGLAPADLEAVYLSGGFGRHLNLESALTLGLLSPGLGPITKPVGNSSFAGSIMLCLDPSLRDKARFLIESSKEFNLSEHPDFSNLFMEHMLFE